MLNKLPQELPLMSGECDHCPIRRLALFQPLSSVALAAAKRYRSDHCRQRAGSHLFLRGEPLMYAYTLYSGWAFLYETVPDGSRQILRFLLPGDFFGVQPEMGSGVRLHSAQALTDVSLCIFPYGDLTSMFRDYIELGIRLIWMTARDEAMAYQHLASLGRRSARERIAHLLLELFYRVCARLPEGALPVESIELPVTQVLIADACGLTQVHVSRTLKGMHQEGLVECKGGRLRIPDRERLGRIAGCEHATAGTRPFI
jgi:CRP/FNR family transcriptional regulator, anaerobic regulatory protein